MKSIINSYSVSMIIVLNFQKDQSTRTEVMAQKPMFPREDGHANDDDSKHNIITKCLLSHKNCVCNNYCIT